MAATDWRIIAQRFNGTGLDGQVIDPELPLSDVVITRQLSAPNTIEGVINPAYLRLLGPAGRLALQDWGVLLVAENGSDIIGGILTASPRSDASATLTAVGLAGYAAGMPYVDAWFGVEVDPLDVVRQVWSHLQGKPGGNLGLEVDATKTGLKIGTALQQGEFDTESGPLTYESGPVKLSWYETQDLGEVIDRLAEETPFDYRERWFYDEAGNMRARLELGYPALGVQRTERFVIGENVVNIPDVTPDGETFANGVLAIGAGEGNAALRSTTGRVDTEHVRRVATVIDSNAKTQAAIDSVANTELAWRVGTDDLSNVIVRDTPAAPITALEPGDHIYLQGEAGQGGRVAAWYRIQSIAMSIDDGSMAELEIQRSDREARAQ